MNNRWFLTIPNIFKRSFYKDFCFSALRIQGSHEVKGILCGTGEVPSAFVHGRIFQRGESNPHENQLATLEGAINELVAIKKHVLALDNLISELHKPSQGP